MNPLLKTDAYKLFHRQMYPHGTSLVYSNFTPRSSKHYMGENKDGVIVFGIQRLIKMLIKEFDDHFFNIPLENALLVYGSSIREFTGDENYSVEHIEYLHRLNYLPLVIKALPEGSFCPIGVPMLTVYNTDPKCFWLTNYLETLFSCELWGPVTSATIAREFRQILESYGQLTGVPSDFIQWQGHDFSLRGMFGNEAGGASGLGHMVFFTGTDTIPAFMYAKKYYPMEGLIGSSVPASEHSVECSHYTSDGDERVYIRHMLDLFSNGIVSMVADGFNFWKFLETLKEFKDEILARDGRVVIRPDSGNPPNIIAGYTPDEFKPHRHRPTYQSVGKTFDESGNVEISEAEYKGAFEILWDIFGGIEVKGDDGKMYKHLDPHIGLIYGDGISLSRLKEICSRLVNKGFSTNNLVLGIGSFTYQHNTRDTFGFAMKATYIELDGKGKNIFKDPITKGVTNKKSAKGLLQVLGSVEGDIILNDEVTWEEEGKGELREVFRDGKLLIEQSLLEIRERAMETL